MPKVLLAAFLKLQIKQLLWMFVKLTI